MNKSHDFTFDELVKIKTVLLIRKGDLFARLENLQPYDDIEIEYSIDSLEDQISSVEQLIDKIDSFLF